MNNTFKLILMLILIFNLPIIYAQQTSNSDFITTIAMVSGADEVNNSDFKSVVTVGQAVTGVVTDGSIYTTNLGIAYVRGLTEETNITLLVITIYSPTNTSYSNTTIDLNVSADKTVDTWWYSLNDGSNTTFTPNTTITATEGQNNITIWANDTVGNEGSSTIYFSIVTTPTTYIHYTSPVVVDQYNNVNINISVSGASDINYSLPFPLTDINISSLNLSNSTETNINYTLTGNYINYSSSATVNYTLAFDVKPILTINTTTYGGCPSPYVDYDSKCRYTTSTDDRVSYYYTYYVNITDGNLSGYNMQPFNISQTDMSNFGSYNIVSLTLNDSTQNITGVLNDGYYNITVTNNTLTQGLYQAKITYFVWKSAVPSISGDGITDIDGVVISNLTLSPTNITIIQPELILYVMDESKYYYKNINITNYNNQTVHFNISIGCVKEDDMCNDIIFVSDDNLTSFNFFLLENQSTNISYSAYIDNTHKRTQFFYINVSAKSTTKIEGKDYIQTVRVEPRFDFYNILDRELMKPWKNEILGRNNLLIKDILLILISISGLVIAFKILVKDESDKND